MSPLGVAIGDDQYFLGDVEQVKEFVNCLEPPLLHRGRQF